MSASPCTRQTWEVLSDILKESGCESPDNMEVLTREIEDIAKNAAVLDTQEGTTPVPLFMDRFVTADGRAPLEKPAVDSHGIIPGESVSTITRWVRKYLERQSKTCRCEL